MTMQRKYSADKKDASRMFGKKFVECCSLPPISATELDSVPTIKQEAIKDDAQIQKILIAQLMGMGRSFMR